MARKKQTSAQTAFKKADNLVRKGKYDAAIRWLRKHKNDPQCKRLCNLLKD